MIPEDERVLGFFLPRTQRGPGEECDPGACTGLKYSSVMTLDENYGGEVRGRGRSLGPALPGGDRWSCPHTPPPTSRRQIFPWVPSLPQASPPAAVERSS